LPIALIVRPGGAVRQGTDEAPKRSFSSPKAEPRKSVSGSPNQASVNCRHDTVMDVPLSGRAANREYRVDELRLLAQARDTVMLPDTLPADRCAAGIAGS